MERTRGLIFCGWKIPFIRNYLRRREVRQTGDCCLLLFRSQTCATCKLLWPKNRREASTSRIPGKSDDVSVAYGSPELHQLVSVPQRRKLFSLLSSVGFRNPGIISTVIFKLAPILPFL